ncbi:MAG: hypothetical protein ACOZAJ_04740 [Patescibacteria group bacterium]
MNNQPDNLKQLVINKITSGQIKMHSKAFFATGRTLSWLSGLLFSLLLILLTSLMFYILRYNSLVFKGSGWAGWGIFFNSLPILILIITTLFGLILSLLAYRQTTAYKKPAVYTVSLVAILSLSAGLLINLTPLHARLSEKAFNQNLPWLGPIYNQNLNGRWSGATAGTLTKISDDIWEIEDSLQKNWQIQIKSYTRFPLGNDFDLGDKIIVRGPADETIITAQGIRKIQDEEKSIFPHMKKGPGKNKLKNQNNRPILPPR